MDTPVARRESDTSFHLQKVGGIAVLMILLVFSAWWLFMRNQRFIPHPPAVPASPVPTIPISGSGCAVAGCSRQLCVEENLADEIVTTCEWQEEYECYKTATCERQKNGNCGWTETAALTQCLQVQ